MFDPSYLHRRHHQLGDHQVRLALLDHHVPLHRQHCCRQPMMILMILRMPSSTQDLFAVMPQLLVTKTMMRLVTKTVMPLMCQLLVTKTMRHVKTLMYQLLVMHLRVTKAVTSSHVWVTAETAMHGLMCQLVTKTVRHVEDLPLLCQLSAAFCRHPACYI